MKRVILFGIGLVIGGFVGFALQGPQVETLDIKKLVDSGAITIDN